VLMQGACYGSEKASHVSVADIVTTEFFNSILDEGDDEADCAGKNFYSRQAFLHALNSYKQFGRTGSADDSKREIAAAFAHFTQETQRESFSPPPTMTLLVSIVNCFYL